ncbi:MAG TPA: MtrB/PioB family decaheme-associated outer membrane protein [Rhizomicrobium sp.]|nr:MtrB/PioB family decaheme-associated outer membrane protein [Rhizomicrobium sp.]
MEPLRWSASVAVLMLLGGPAFADTSILGYGGPGNVLNPTGQLMNLPRDLDGLSQLDDVTRTPTGLLYPIPYAYPEMTQSKSDPDMWGTGWIEGGVLGTFGQRTNSAAFGEYTDWSNGPIVTSLGFLTENRKTAWYAQGLAENLGRLDQYYQLKTGRYGVYSVTAFFDSIPHLYSTEARSLWQGSSDNLTLRGGLVPGSSTAAQVDAVLATVAPTELRVTREKAGLSLNYTPWDDIEIVAQLTHEWRSGTQPFSATFGYPFQNGATQLIEPIHYRTVDVTTALRYKEDDLQANLTYTGSFFRNNDQSLTWQNPGLAQVPPGSYIPPEGRLSLPPSNNYNMLKGDLTALVSPDVRFSANMSYALMRQDGSLLPPTLNSGIIPGAGGPIDLAEWNTTSALSRLRAGAAIDVFNAFAQLQYMATPDLTFDFELRDRDERNMTNYVAFNPQTGEFGYIAIDGGLGPFIPALSGVYQPNAPGSVVQIRNMPFANDNLQLTAKGSYRLANHMKLEFSYVHNSIEHSVREVPNADDNRVRLQFDANGYEWGSVRFSYEYGRLTGSDYTSNPYTPYYSTSLPGYVPLSPAGDIPFTLENLRKFDVANRNEHVLHAQSNFIVTPRTDLQLSGDYKIDDYDAQYGLHSASSLDFNADINYQASTAATITGFFTWQSGNRDMSTINPLGLPGTAAAGGPNFPFANAWSESLADRNYTAGLTAHRRWDAISLDLNYIYTHGDSAIGYAYASTGAFFGLLTPAQAGNAFPDITFASHSFEGDLRWQALPQLSYRLLYRVDFENLNDFHYTGLTAGVFGNNTYLGVVPENFTAQTVGLLMQYTF